MQSLELSIYASPLGDIQLLTVKQKLCYLDFADNPERMEKLMKTRYGEYEIIQAEVPTELNQCLNQYFSGDLDAFDDIEMDTGGTSFQRKVWRSLLKIPHGTTMDYSTLAHSAGNASAVRAAASSNARNPISIIIPCHRVIGKDGSLRGYAGGIDRKRWLLRHEGVAI